MRGSLILALVAGCYVVPAPTPPPPPPPRIVAAPAPAPVPVEIVRPVADPASDLYPLDVAVEDALSGPWEHIGSGAWFGNARIHACAYRNARVIVVNVYCTVKEAPAFRVDIFSPTRGRARIYAEASAPISTLARDGFFSFKGESEPLDTAGAEQPAVDLDMTFAELVLYEERRYKRYAPACYGGVELHRPQSGCLRQLGPRKRAWKARNQPFLDAPPEGFYRIVRELRALAPQHGRRVKTPPGAGTATPTVGTPPPSSEPAASPQPPQSAPTQPPLPRANPPS